MLIVCPNCATSYQIEPGLVGASERSVRCARCLSVWTMDARAAVPAIVRTEDSEILAQGPLIPPPERHVDAGAASLRSEPLPAAATAAGPTEAPAAIAGADTPGHGLAEAKVEADEAEQSFDADPGAGHVTADETALPVVDPDTLSIVPAQGLDDETRPSTDRPVASQIAISFAKKRVARSDSQRAQKRTMMGVGVALLAACNLALVGFRDGIVRSLPQTAPLYAAIGLPVNLRGLAFADVHTSYGTLEGVDVLMVEGAITSESAKPIAVPHIRVSVRNAAHQEIYAWTTKPDHALARPQEQIAFKARLASPPKDAHDVVVRFTNGPDPRGRSL